MHACVVQGPARGECLLDGRVVESKGEVEKAEKRKRLAVALLYINCPGTRNGELARKQETA